VGGVNLNCPEPARPDHWACRSRERDRALPAQALRRSDWHRANENPGTPSMHLLEEETKK